MTQKTKLEIAQEKLAQARQEVKDLKQKYTLRGAKVLVNKVYNDLYKQDLTETEKIKLFWLGVEKARTEFAEGD